MAFLNTEHWSLIASSATLVDKVNDFLLILLTGPSKSLTFEEGVGAMGSSGEGAEGGEEGKKVPDACCPIICERM